ncbi:MAG: hypothetical protein KJP11_08375 [Gammaproteobacteria bacterium]|nr:hypothetical protein [Gammaproteobacteria bacterium]
MNDEITLPPTGRTDFTDATDNSLITDFTLAVSSVVGKDRAERRQQKIRDEIVRQYFGTDRSEVPSFKFSFKKLFRLN